MASSTITLPTFQTSLLRKQFLGQTNIFNGHKPQSLTLPKHPFHLNPTAKFDLFQIMGGRGLCNGEQGIQNELKRNIEQEASSTMASLQNQTDSTSDTKKTNEEEAESGFDKELMGLTGGFPGGEKGLKKFIEQNPPPPPEKTESRNGIEMSMSKKSKAPELPLLMPGMIALVSNPNSPYYMYCGIVQRITDGKAGVLFEGGIWDRLITFRLEELERREKGPPTKSPRSVMIEPFLQLDSKS